MFDTMPARPPMRLRMRYVVFALIGAMIAYVLFHNESFLIQPAHPLWPHYQTLGLWLLVHGVAGGSALILAPMQFSDRLRARFTKLHRVSGRIYVTGALILAPMGAYIQYMDERLGLGPRSFTVETIIQASLLIITTAIGLAFAMKRMIPQHRQWMTRSYAAALTFFEIRLILGVMGWDNDPVIVETVVWSCTASAILLGDIANQIYELRSMRPRRARMPASAQPIAAE
ncbi:MAG TPA: DUF2306 domain-containing protein [Micropepsaceae bacterium]|nr:DUF2306 domain-containing protein [Micropepsaceae bacterium]